VVLPQQVDPERPMAASTINRAGVVAGGTAAVATVAETARTVADVKYSAQALGDWLVPILLLAVVGLCGYIVWERVKQRKGGWA
jgi:lysozyme